MWLAHFDYEVVREFPEAFLVEYAQSFEPFFVLFDGVGALRVLTHDLSLLVVELNFVERALVGPCEVGFLEVFLQDFGFAQESGLDDFVFFEFFF